MELKRFLCYMSSAIFMVACNMEEDCQISTKEPIRLSSDIYVESDYPNAASLVTRGIQETALADGEKLYVWAQQSGTSSYSYLQAWELTSASGLLNGSTKYYPNDNTSLSFAAVHGNFTYSEGTSMPDSITHNVYNNQSTDANYHKSDLIYGSGTGSKSANAGTPVSLGLIHKLAKIEINLSAGAGYTSEQLSAGTTSVSIDKLKRTIAISPATGQLGTASNPTTIIAHKSGNSFEMVVPPQKAPKYITIKVGSVSCPVPTNVSSFVSNRRYVYNVTVTNSDIGVSLNSITNTSTQYKGYYIGTNGKAYPTRELCSINSGSDAVAVIAYVGRVSHYFDNFIAIALEKAQEHAFGWLWTSTTSDAYKWAQSHAVTVNGTTYNTIPISAYDYVPNNQSASSATRTGSVIKGWRVPSVTDWRYIFAGVSNQLSATSPVGIEHKKANNITTTESTNEASVLQSAFTSFCGGNFNWWSVYHFWASSEVGTTTSNSAWCYYPTTYSSGTDIGCWIAGAKTSFNPGVYLAFAY